MAKQKYIVELESGVYLTDGSGDPARTVLRSNAKQYCEIGAKIALGKARKYRPFPNADILEVLPNYLKVGGSRKVGGKTYEAVEGGKLTCRGCVFLSNRKECELITVHKVAQMCHMSNIIYKLVK